MIFRIIKYILIGLLLLPLSYLVLALLFSYVPNRLGTTSKIKTHTIFIHSNGVHLDLILPNRQLPIALKEQIKAPEHGFTSFGWGDKDFYLNTPEWKDLSFKTAFNALFCTSETLMHIDRFSYPNTSWDSIKVSEKGFEQLTKYIENSFAKDSLNNLYKIPDAHYNSTDNFYKAVGSYSCFKTCNTWANIALKQSDFTTSLWTPFDFGIMYHVRNQ